MAWCSVTAQGQLYLFLPFMQPAGSLPYSQGPANSEVLRNIS